MLMAQSGLTPDERYSPGSRVAMTPMIYVAVLQRETAPDTIAASPVESYRDCEPA